MQGKGKIKIIREQNRKKEKEKKRLKERLIKYVGTNEQNILEKKMM